jgi:ABC-type nitrate/sulfonate/bicarbonate transport system substrate-binding protein
MKDRIRRLLGVSILIAFFGADLVPAANAQDVIRVSYPAPDAGYAALWAAKDLGFFEKNGVKVELVYIASTPIGMAALMADEIDVITGGAGGIISANLAGSSDLVLFAGMTRTLPFSLFSKPSIASIPQLKGGRVGITRFGSTFDFAARWVLSQSSMDARKDVTLLQIGNVPGILASLKAESIDAGILSFPSSWLAKKAGLRELADLAAMGVKYQKEAFGARKGFLEKKKDSIKRFIAGLVAAIDFVKSHPEETIKIIGKYTKTEEKEALQSAYDLLVRKYLPSAPTVSAEYLTLILNDLGEKNPNIRNTSPNRFIFDQYTREVLGSRAGQ